MKKLILTIPLILCGCGTASSYDMSANFCNESVQSPTQAQWCWDRQTHQNGMGSSGGSDAGTDSGESDGGEND